MDNILIISVFVFLLAGTVKGVVGIGMPLTTIGILSQIIDPRLAVTLAIFPILVSNAWQVFRAGGAFGALKRYWRFAAALAVVVLLTSSVATRISADMLVVILGGVIVLFAVVNLAFKPPQLPDRFDKPAQIVMGALAGVFGGLTAIWAPPMVVYLLSRGVEKDEFIRASGVLFLCGSVPLLIGYVQNGLIDGETAKLSILLIIPTLLGFAIGEHIRRFVSQEKFRTILLIVFLLVGLNLLRRGLF